MAALALPAQAPSCGLLLLCDQIFWNTLLNTAECACLPLIFLINCACWECCLVEGCLLSSSSWDQSYRSHGDCLWSVGIAFLVVKSTGRQAGIRLVLVCGWRERIRFDISSASLWGECVRGRKGKRRGLWGWQAMSSQEWEDTKHISEVITSECFYLTWQYPVLMILWLDVKSIGSWWSLLTF